MNYYSHHIGDYTRDTAHLSLLEDGVYRRMLDLYYASERPLPLNVTAIYRLVRAKSVCEKAAVDAVLAEFFTKGETGFHNKRADQEIAKSKEEGEANAARRENEKERQRRHRERRQNLFAGLREHGITPPWDATTEELQQALERCTSQQSNAPVTRDITATPLANSHKPITNNQSREATRSRGSRLPSDWQPSEHLKAWASKERPDLDLTATVERFHDHWRAAAGSKGVKLDWEATFRNWVRNERSPLRSAVPDYSGVIANLKD